MLEMWKKLFKFILFHNWWLLAFSLLLATSPLEGGRKPS